MIVRFEPSGTHVRNGFLMARLDFVPEVSEESYKRFFLPVGMSGENIITPCLSHFFAFNPTQKLSDIRTELLGLLTPDFVCTLDKLSAVRDSARIRKLMLFVKGTSKPSIGDFADMVGTWNTRLQGVTLNLQKGTNVIQIEPGTIDMGGDPIDRATYGSSGYTHIDLNNPANATGIITQAEFFPIGTLVSYRVGSFYLVSGTTYKCRASSANLGGFAVGYRIVTGLSFAVTSGDFAGWYGTTSNGINVDTGAPVGSKYILGAYIDADDSASYTDWAGRIHSNYLTGTESGGVTFVPRVIVI